MSKKVRMAVVGGSRGAAFGNALISLADKVELAAVCDLNEDVLKGWEQKYPGIATFTSYEVLLDSPTIDAVFLATPMLIHASQAVQALKAGKHVLSEVIGSHTHEDSWALIEAVKRSGLTYMMAENYCYMRENMMVENMAGAGAFGEITYAECGYIHDIRDLLHYGDGSLTWRGHYIRDYNGSTYPTHSLGPVAKWLGINQEGGDAFDELITVSSKSRATSKYFLEHFGADNPASHQGHWNQGDSSTTLIRTKNGVLISLRFDVLSSRPHNMTHYGLQGTEGAYLAPRYHGEDPLVWLEKDFTGGPDIHPEWSSLWKYKEQWEHPHWQQWSEQALSTGHGGGDFFVMQEFVNSILENRKPAVDVYDAVTWSSVFPLSVQSVAAGGAPVKFVDFLKGN